jgi:surface antigen
VNPGLAITMKMLLAASQIADIDEAVASVQDQVGIDEGDIADMAIGEHRDAWAGATVFERLTWLEQWRDAEIAHGPAEPQPAMTNEEYVKTGGCCPACRCGELDGGPFTVDGVTASQEVSCSACDAKWHDTYRLTGYTELETDN